MAETTLNQLAASIARRAGLYAAGTASAGTTTTLTDASLIQPDNLWNNCYVHFLSGTYAGQERLISSSDQDTATITFAPALAGVVTNGMTYEISPLQRADIDQAVADAVRSAGNAWMQIEEDSLTLNGEQLYALNVNTVAVLDVLVYSAEQPGDSGVWSSLQDWVVIGIPGARKLMLRSWNALHRSYAAKVRYLAVPSVPSTGSGSMGLGETEERQALAYVQEYALHVVHEMLLARNVTGEMARAHLSLSNNHLKKAEAILAAREPKREPRTMRGWRVGGQV